MSRPAPAPSVHETAYRVRFDEAGPDGSLRTSGLMRFAQDLAWLHSTALGFGREWYAERGLTWLVRAAELEVLAPAPMGTNVLARTEVVGMRRVFARRLGQFRLADGTPVARVTTDWVLIDHRGALTRVPPIFGELFGVGDATFTIGRVALDRPPESLARRDLVVRPHEVDPYAHANNAIYLDWLEETVGEAGGADALVALPRRYRLEYAVAVEAGAALVAEAWPGADGWSFRLARAVTGDEVFRARLQVGAGPADDTVVGETQEDR